jgi:hypothetical protein
MASGDCGKERPMSFFQILAIVIAISAVIVAVFLAMRGGEKKKDRG